jgi:hypothetical protein
MASTAPLRASATADLSAPQPVSPIVVGFRQLEIMAFAAMVGPEEQVASRFLSDIDDWCRTGWPKWWPQPSWPDGAPDSSVYLGAAVAAAQLADSAPDGEAREMLDRAASALIGRARD